MARRAVRLRQPDRGRHRYRSGRRRLPFRPIDAARGHRHRQGFGRDHCARQKNCRARARSRGARHRIRGRHLHRERDRSLDRHSSWYARRAPAAIFPAELTGLLAAGNATTPSTSAAFPTAATSARSRSTPISGRWRSRAMSPSTTLAARSTPHPARPVARRIAQGVGQALRECCVYDADAAS